MRLRRKPWVDTAIHTFDSFVYPKDHPAGEEERGHWHAIFGRSAPLFAELGTGKGDFISQIAAREPEHDFIGIEVEQDVLYRAAVKVAALSLPNVRLLAHDVRELAALFAPGEIDGIYLNFCDPWPKKRHLKRRLTHRDFLALYQSLVKPGGRLWFKTDNRPLFEFSLDEFAARGLTVRRISYDLHAEAPPDNIETEYERKFSSFGEKIHRCEVIFP